MRVSRGRLLRSGSISGAALLTGGVIGRRTPSASTAETADRGGGHEALGAARSAGG